MEPGLTEKIKPVKFPLCFFVCTVSNLVAPVVKLGDAASVHTYGFTGASVTEATFTYLKFIHWVIFSHAKDFYVAPHLRLQDGLERIS